ncbi:MAG: LysM domain-containing protein [Lachnospiraceae bacterium]|nr:LysM domain-containing protein [Lachnospiraceae bacterium]
MNYEFCEGITHTIKKGDTLYSISRQHNVPIAMIMRANPYVDVYNLQVGETICVPVEKENMGVRNPEMTAPRRNVSPDMMSGPGNTNMPNMTNAPGTNSMPGMTNVPGNNMVPEMPAMPENNMMPDMTNTSDMSYKSEEDDDDSCISQSDMEGKLVRYVTQPGDTLQDILDRSGGDERRFWMKNSSDKMYMLPGISYYIYED